MNIFIFALAFISFAAATNFSSDDYASLSYSQASFGETPVDEAKMSKSVVSLADALKVSKEKKALLLMVDFYANWCGPCKALAPTLESIAETYSSKVQLVKVDVEECPEEASKYGISSLPTVVFFKEGVDVGKFTGALSKDDVIARIEKYL